MSSKIKKIKNLQILHLISLYVSSIIQSSRAGFGFIFFPTTAKMAYYEYDTTKR